MKHFHCIFIFITSILFSETKKTDVKHMIVEYKGRTTECFIDSIGYEYLYFTPKDSVDKDSMKLKDVYYAYNDFNRVFHYSWSFEENIRRIENRAGKLFTVSGDTLDFIGITFNHDMIHPEILVKTEKGRSEYVSMFDVESIETDYSIMSYSVKNGFNISFYSFLIVTAIDVLLNWDKERRASPQIWDQYNDLMPKISPLGFNKQEGTGVAYESFTALIPGSVMISMAYDVYSNKNEFYFTPVLENKEFGRSMYVFSLKHILDTQLMKVIFMLEKSKLGRKVIEWFR